MVTKGLAANMRATLGEPRRAGKVTLHLRAHRHSLGRSDATA